MDCLCYHCDNRRTKNILKTYVRSFNEILFMTTESQPRHKNYYENKAWAQGLYTCGIDEVGRGCLAGPVVVAAVIIPQNCSYYLLKDSKIMDEAERDKAYKWIIKHCFYSVAISSNNVIDKINIYQATLLTMKKAYMQLVETMPYDHEQLKYVLIDAMPLIVSKSYTHKNLEFRHFNYGESRSISIAAASIIAKVTRDKLMKSMSTLFPALLINQHKGYGTKQHIALIESLGPTIVHRSSFIGKILSKTKESQAENKENKENKENYEQQKLF